jgi:ribosomal protein S18 acetylase RimI-like enzyme
MAGAPPVKESLGCKPGKAAAMSISQADTNQLLPAGGDNAGQIVLIGPARRAEAIERLVGGTGGDDQAAARRFLAYAGEHSVRLDGLWSRLGPGGRIAFSVLAVPNTGRTAMFFASHPRRPPDVPAIAGLIDHVCAQITGWDVELAQALMEPTEVLDQAAYREAGFHDLAVLGYLELALTNADPPAPRWPRGARLETYRPALDGDLVRILEASYRDTLDCPGLRGLRRTGDVMAGHKATGRFDPALWTLLYLDEEPVGVILLNAFPAQRTVELVYLGLSPAARGRGLGRQLLRHGLCQLRGRDERTLTLAVDERNAPALGLYQSEGMRLMVRRAAMIRPLREGR